MAREPQLNTVMAALPTDTEYKHLILPEVGKDSQPNNKQQNLRASITLSFHIFDGFDDSRYTHTVDNDCEDQLNKLFLSSVLL